MSSDFLKQPRSNGMEASCRAPLTLMILSAVAWLVVGALLGFVASVTIHWQGFADVSWLTYGRLHPASTNAFLYGFAIQAGLAVAIWLICQMGRARLAGPLPVMMGTAFWNIGVTIGVFGILAGESSGFEWFEMPGIANLILFSAYTLIAGFALVTFHHRKVRELYPSMWFLVAALFWFPWIYTTASILLVGSEPVRGTMQAVVNWWYANNLSAVVFGFVGLGALFYFIPKLTGRPLFSRFYALTTFWLMALIAPFGGIPAGAPVPAWLPSISAAAAVLLIVPLLATQLNIHHTLGKEHQVTGWQRPDLRFFLFGAVAFVAVGFLSAVGPGLEVFNHVYPSLYNGSPMAEIFGVVETTPFDKDNFVQFTLLSTALTQLSVYGFFAMTLFGAIYYIVPRITGADWPSARLQNLHWLLAVGGLALIVIPLAIAGVYQGYQLSDGLRGFNQLNKFPMMMLQVSTVGHLFLLGAAVALLANLKILLWRACCPCCVPAFLRESGAKNKPAEAAS
jgi:cytochrome c oxidase cbb3-type subunit 1